MVLVCIVKNCRIAKSATKEVNCNLFRIPKDLSQSKLWLNNCGRQDLGSKTVENLHNNYRVCMNHFKGNMFSSPEKTRLLPNAVPTEFVSEMHPSTSKYVDVSTSVDLSTNLSSPSTSVVSSSSTSEELKITSSSPAASTQTPTKLTLNTPRKIKLKVKLSELSTRCAQLEKQVETLTMQMNETLLSVNHFYDVCDVHLPPNLSLIVKSYVKIAISRPQGFRYSKELKQLAITIYFFGPRAYQFLKNFCNCPAREHFVELLKK